MVLVHAEWFTRFETFFCKTKNGPLTNADHVAVVRLSAAASFCSLIWFNPNGVQVTYSTEAEVLPVNGKRGLVRATKANKLLLIEQIEVCIARVRVFMCVCVCVCVCESAAKWHCRS